MSPLLPPVADSRSTSPDEIPGLGGLSFRRPFSLPPQFVAPTLTARTVTDGSSWHISEPEKEVMKEPLDDTQELLQYPISEPPDESEGPNVETTVPNDPPPNGITTHVEDVTLSIVGEGLSSNTSVQESGRETSIGVFPSLLAPKPVTHSTRSFHSQSSQYDEDSDMDFGTPVTSPLIIVPGPKVDDIDMLPLPLSPGVGPNPTLERNDTTPQTDPAASQTRRKSPGSTVPPTTDDTRSTPRMTVSKPQILRDTTPTPTPKTMSSHQVEGEQLETVERNPVSDALIRDASLIDKADQAPASVGTAPQPASTSPSESSLPADSIAPIQIPTSTPSDLISSTPIGPAAPIQTSLPTPMPDSTTFAMSHPIPIPLAPSRPAQIPSTVTQPISISVPNNTTSSELVAPLALSNSRVFGESIAQSNIILNPEANVTHALQHSETENAENGRSSAPPSVFSSIESHNSASDVPMSQLPFQSTPRHSPVLYSNPSDSGQHMSDEPHLFAQDQSQITQSTVRLLSSNGSLNDLVLSNLQSTARKRQRDRDEDEEDEDEMTFKSQKRGEGLSIREGGIVVRKVVSMVRDTLTGLNDLLEIAAERDLIPSERTRGRSKGKARAVEIPFMDESPTYTPTPPSPLIHTPFRPRMQPESSEVARLNEELRLMKAEMAQLKEQKARETPVEHDNMKAMRTEMETLREQLRTLKEGKAPVSSTSEVQVMRDEIVSLKNEMRSLLSTSRRSPLIPSTPSTPSLSLRFNNHTMSQTIHPLAHLLAIEPDTVPPTPTTASTVIQSEASQSEGESMVPTQSQNSQLPFGDGSEKESNAPPTVPQSPSIFDDLPLPVKSKRKARMIFSRS